MTLAVRGHKLLASTGISPSTGASTSVRTDAGISTNISTDAGISTSISTGTGTRAIGTKLGALMELHQVALQMYCRGLTGSVWEAEDLAQDTWFKVFKHLSQAPDERTLSKTYLYRIAKNTWIDHCRKNKFALDALADDLDLAAAPPIDSFEVEAVLETLIAELPPRQRIILLLMDVLRYTAAETARLLNSTEEAVKASLHRARRRLGRFQSRLAADSKPTAAANRKAVQVDEQIVKAYLEAFQHKNPYALANLLNDQAGIDLLPVITGSKQKRPQTPQQANRRGSNDCYSLRCRADGEGRTFLRHLLPVA